MPYNCEFIIIHPLNNKNYKLTEIYKLKNKIFFKDFGIWNYYSGVNISGLSFLMRRIDLNGTELVLEREEGDGVRSILAIFF